MSDRPPTIIESPLTEADQKIAELFNPQGINAFLLGANQPGSQVGAVWVPTHVQGHALTFGTSRQGGKGTTTIIPALLTYAGSMVVIDPKGENAWITAERRRQLGQRVVIIDPWGEVNRRYGKAAGKEEAVTRFNPLSALRADDPDFADDVAAIADALIIPSGNDSHWSDSAGELIAGLIAHEVADNPGEASLRQVRYALTVGPEALAAVAKEVVTSAPDSLAARKLGRFTTVTPELSSIISTAITQTAILDSPALLDGMETDETPFELEDIAKQRVTVYLVIPPNRLQTHGRWLRMLLTLMINAVSRLDRPPALPVVFMVDEAGTLNPVKGGGLKMLEQAFGLLAGLGVVVWMFFQDLNQMKRDYPDSWETFIANSAVIQILNARDNTTAKYVSDYFGERIMILPGSVSGEGVHAKLHPTEIHRFTKLPAFKVRDDTLTRQLILFPGRASYSTGKVHYYTEPRFKGFYRDNPLFAAAKAAALAKPVVSPEEATRILTRASYSVSAAVFGNSWKVKGPGQDGSLKEAELLELAKTVRNQGM